MQKIRKRLAIIRASSENIRKKAIESLKNAPKGRLRVVKTKGKSEQLHPRIFLVTEEHPGNGKYLSLTKDQQLIKNYVQCDYDRKIVEVAGQLTASIDSFLKECPEVRASELFTDEPWRRELIQPYIESDREFVAQWELVTWKGRPFLPDTPELYTAKGERVRSKSEVIIADTLNRLGIPYRYEYPLKLKTIPGHSAETATPKRTVTFYPDFTILDVAGRRELILEHFGRLEDPVYAAEIVEKLHMYAAAGYFLGDTLLITTESQAHPLSSSLVESTLKNALDY